jgi:hypothetical protein
MKKKKISKFKRWLIEKLGGKVPPEREIYIGRKEQKVFLFSAVVEEFSEVGDYDPFGYEQTIVKRKLTKELCRQLMKVIPEECILHTEDKSRCIDRYRVNLQVMFPDMK